MIPDGGYWLSTDKMTVYAEVKDDIIINAAPIIRKFINQPAINLWRWLDKLGNFTYANLDE